MIFEFSAYILIIRSPQFFFFRSPHFYFYFFPAKKLLNFDIFISPSEVIEGKQILPSLPIDSLPPFFLILVIGKPNYESYCFVQHSCACKL